MNAHHLSVAVGMGVFFVSVDLPAIPAVTARSGGQVVRLPVPWEKATVVSLVPPEKAGTSSPEFETKEVEATGGVIEIPVGDTPLLVRSTSARGQLPKTPAESPFGIHGVDSDYEANLAALPELGGRWARCSGISGVIWDLIEPDKGTFLWKNNDELYGRIAAEGIGIFATAATARWGGPPRDRFPEDLPAYLNFLKAAVERYDGDQIRDAPGSPVISCWQFGNEIDDPRCWQGGSGDYMRFLSKCYPVVKKAAPASQVAMAGIANPRGYYDYFAPMLDRFHRTSPGTRCFDVVDLHWSRQFKGSYDSLEVGGKKYRLDKTLADIRAQLDRLGLKDVSIWMTEVSDYSGSPETDPFLGSYAPQTESDQAKSLCKMFVTALASGADRVFWVYLMDPHNFGGQGEGGYFDHSGLMYNPRSDGESRKKTAFFTYRFLASVLSGFDRKQTSVPDLPPGLRGYRFVRNGEPFYFLWRDSA